MKYLLLILLYSCSQVPLKKTSEHELVTLDTALDHIRTSYLKGCVDGFREMNIPVSFELCRDRAKNHEAEVKQIIDYVP